LFDDRCGENGYQEQAERCEQQYRQWGRWPQHFEMEELAVSEGL
jgi:hypothetical protein